MHLRFITSLFKKKFGEWHFGKVIDSAASIHVIELKLPCHRTNGVNMPVHFLMLEHV